jgi:hypothetical protein
MCWLMQSYYFMDTDEFRLRNKLGRVHSYKLASQGVCGLLAADERVEEFNIVTSIKAVIIVCRQQVSGTAVAQSV